MFFPFAPRVASHCAEPFPIARQQFAKFVRQSFRRCGAHQESGVLVMNHFRYAPYWKRHDWNPRGKRFRDHAAHGLLLRWHNQKIQFCVNSRDIFAPSEKIHSQPSCRITNPVVVAIRCE